MPTDRAQVVKRTYDVFRSDVDAIPLITLRGGDALDSYDEPPPFDPDVDDPTEAYLEAYPFNGLSFLDPPSWRHYLPRPGR